MLFFPWMMLQEGASPTPVYPSQSKKQPLPSTNSRSLGGVVVVTVLGFPTLHVATASGTEGVSTWELPLCQFFCSLSEIHILGGFAWGVSFLGGWGGKGLGKQTGEATL